MLQNTEYEYNTKKILAVTSTTEKVMPPSGFRFKNGDLEVEHCNKAKTDYDVISVHHQHRNDVISV